MAQGNDEIFISTSAAAAVVGFSFSRVHVTFAHLSGAMPG